MKIRVFQLARELKVQPEALVTVISSLGVDVKNPMSALDDELVEQVRRKMAAERAGTRRDVVKKDVRRAAAGATSTASTSTSASTTASVSAPASTPPPPRTTTTTVTTETVRHTPPPAPTPKPAPASKVTSKPKSPSAKPTGAPASAPPAASQPAVPPAATDASTVRREGYSPGRAPQDTGSAPLGPSRTPHIGSANAGRPSASGFRQTALGSRPGQKRKKKKGRQVDEQAVRASVRRTLATLDSGRSKRRRRRGSGEENEELAAQPLKVHEFATVAELASLMEVRPTEVIAKCLQLGILANINRRLEKDEIAAIMDEFGHEAEFVTEYGVERIQEEEELDEVSDAPLAPRAPIVTVMGHVDHGKTTLLDHIRKTRVTEQESGGITQHIGAYRVETSGGTICFLDTPGHEAFTAMRARGARITDEVVLVVAANDEVRPQTIEAINHAKAAGVPLVVAINKIDVNGANPDNIRKGLSDAGVLVESWGGKTVDVEISAKKGMNVEKLLEMIVLEAELLDLKAQPGRTARGAVIEARRDAGRGIVATVLVQDGTLHIGDSFVCGSQFGRVRAMSDERGARLEEAGPSTPVEVLGWSGVPH
ncbi:MAG: translation initiation factor IF-2, partial [Candidatus Eisenbacteria bacterium]|nr:translation initiation factor IF-2 [Candidatus Eisenbacteria bacterium]